MTFVSGRFAFVSFSALALVTGFGSAGVCADEAYRLAAGDVVAVNVAGLPDLSREAEVQLDGSLSLALVGEVAAAGRTLEEVREVIRASIASRLVSVYTSDGEKHLRAVSRDEVTAWIAAYRPLFVSGEVAKPGEFRYQPGFTVRQAIAAAGGVVPLPIAGPVTNTAGLEADYKGAWNALAATEARIWRLRGELGDKSTFNLQSLPPAPDGTTALDDILKAESDLRMARDLDHERERAFLKRALDQIARQTGVLTRQLEAEKASEALDAADIKLANEAAGKGIYTQSRMADLRSAALLSTTRRLQTEANLMQLERRSIEVARDLERLDDRRHLDVLEELQQAQVKRAAGLATLNEIAARMSVAGVAMPGVDTARQITVSVVRAGSTQQVTATPDLELMPGDVVQVSRGAPITASQSGAKAYDMAPPYKTADQG